MSFPGTLQLCTFALLCLASRVIADYYVDNSNKSAIYAPSGTTWQTYSLATKNVTFVLGNGDYIAVDSSKCYDQNYALATCTVDNNCQITFPFTVYVMHAGLRGISASLTIDGAQSITTILPPPVPPSYQTLNVSLFSHQSLPSADHTATINLLDWENNTTSLYFDYALVNESHVESPASSVASSATKSLATQPTSPASGSNSSPNLDVVLASTFGAVAFIALVTAIIFLKKWRSCRIALEKSYRTDPYQTPSQAHSPMNEMMRAADPTLRHSRRQSDGESSDFRFRSGVGSASNVETRPSVTDPSSRDDSFMDRGREGDTASDARGSLEENGTILAGTINSCYQPAD